MLCCVVIEKHQGTHAPPLQPPQDAELPQPTASVALQHSTAKLGQYKAAHCKGRIKM
jgi:hypothetical protein